MTRNHWDDLFFKQASRSNVCHQWAGEKIPGQEHQAEFHIRHRVCAVLTYTCEYFLLLYDTRTTFPVYKTLFGVYQTNGGGTPRGISLAVHVYGHKLQCQLWFIGQCTQTDTHVILSTCTHYSVHTLINSCTVNSKYVLIRNLLEHTTASWVWAERWRRHGEVLLLPQKICRSHKEMTPSDRLEILTDALLHYGRRKSSDLGTHVSVLVVKMTHLHSNWESWQFLLIEVQLLQRWDKEEKVTSLLRRRFLPSWKSPRETRL